MSEFNSTLDQIGVRVKNAAPFAIYSLPGQDSLNVVFADRECNPGEPSFIFAPFVGEPITIPLERKVSIGIDYSQLPPKLNPSPTEIGKPAFVEIVELAKQQISEGTFSKVVLSRSEFFKGNFNFSKSFASLLGAYRSAFRYCWFHPKSGLWMGATPELLLKSDGDSFSTVALAGTRSGESVGDWPEKERDEQFIVSQYIAEKAKALAGEVSVSEPYTAMAGNLSHIKSDISGKLQRGHNAIELAQILHPTPAVCGFPKDEALEFILSNEGYSREFYSGYLGQSDSSGNTELYVNLRCTKAVEGGAYLFAGCGITADSEPVKEYFETAAKTMTIKNILYES